MFTGTLRRPNTIGFLQRADLPPGSQRKSMVAMRECGARQGGEGQRASVQPACPVRRVGSLAAAAVRPVGIAPVSRGSFSTARICLKSVGSDGTIHRPSRSHSPETPPT